MNPKGASREKYYSRSKFKRARIFFSSHNTTPSCDIRKKTIWLIFFFYLKTSEFLASRLWEREKHMGIPPPVSAWKKGKKKKSFGILNENHQLFIVSRQSHQEQVPGWRGKNTSFLLKKILRYLMMFTCWILQDTEHNMYTFLRLRIRTQA